jgi:hypothetical protein
MLIIESLPKPMAHFLLLRNPKKPIASQPKRIKHVLANQMILKKKPPSKREFSQPNVSVETSTAAGAAIPTPTPG